MSKENSENMDNNEEESEEGEEEEEKEKEERKEEEKEKNEEIEKEDKKEIEEEEEKREKDEEKKEKELNINRRYIMSQESEETELKEEPKKLIIMLIPKMKKDLPMPLNTLFFFIELFSYENNLKKITDEDNKLVFYLMNIPWLNEFKSYYNYKCIEYIINKELKQDKNFVNKIDNLIKNQNPAKYYEDYKLLNKFNNIIINPKKKKKNFDENEEDFMPMKIEYDVTRINKNITSTKLDMLEFFKYFPRCVLINEKMRNILYVEYKYLKFSQFQKGDITMVKNLIFIKLSNRIIEVCSFSHKNLMITPLYILYYFDISFVPFWENVLYQKDFKKDYLLKRIDLDNKHIQCMLDPYNKEYIGYCINLNIPYGGEPINDFDEEKSVIADIKNDELLNNIDIISKFNMDGYYKNKFEENNKKNSEDDSYNNFLLRMKLLREKKAKELMEVKQQYIETFNLFGKTKKSETDKSGAVNINGEIIGFVQGDDLTKNGEGYLKSSKDSDYISSINEMENNKKK